MAQRTQSTLRATLAVDTPFEIDGMDHSLAYSRDVLLCELPAHNAPGLDLGAVTLPFGGIVTLDAYIALNDRAEQEAIDHITSLRSPNGMRYPLRWLLDPEIAFVAGGKRVAVASEHQRSRVLNLDERITFWWPHGYMEVEPEIEHNTMLEDWEAAGDAKLVAWRQRFPVRSDERNRHRVRIELDHAMDISVLRGGPSYNGKPNLMREAYLGFSLQENAYSTSYCQQLVEHGLSEYSTGIEWWSRKQTRYSLGDIARVLHGAEGFDPLDSIQGKRIYVTAFSEGFAPVHGSFIVGRTAKLELWRGKAWDDEEENIAFRSDSEVIHQPTSADASQHAFARSMEAGRGWVDINVSVTLPEWHSPKFPEVAWLKLFPHSDVTYQVRKQVLLQHGAPAQVIELSGAFNARMGDKWIVELCLVHPERWALPVNDVLSSRRFWLSPSGFEEGTFSKELSLSMPEAVLAPEPIAGYCLMIEPSAELFRDVSLPLAVMENGEQVSRMACSAEQRHIFAEPPLGWLDGEKIHHFRFAQRVLSEHEQRFTLSPANAEEQPREIVLKSVFAAERLVVQPRLQLDLSAYQHVQGSARITLESMNFSDAFEVNLAEHHELKLWIPHGKTQLEIHHDNFLLKRALRYRDEMLRPDLSSYEALQSVAIVMDEESHDARDAEPFTMQCFCLEAARWRSSYGDPAERFSVMIESGAGRAPRMELRPGRWIAICEGQQLYQANGELLTHVLFDVPKSGHVDVQMPEVASDQQQWMQSGKASGSLRAAAQVRLPGRIREAIDKGARVHAEVWCSPRSSLAAIDLDMLDASAHGEAIRQALCIKLEITYCNEMLEIRGLRAGEPCDVHVRYSLIQPALPYVMADEFDAGYDYWERFSTSFALTPAASHTQTPQVEWRREMLSLEDD